MDEFIEESINDTLILLKTTMQEHEEDMKVLAKSLNQTRAQLALLMAEVKVLERALNKLHAEVSS